MAARVFYEKFYVTDKVISDILLIILYINFKKTIYLLFFFIDYEFYVLFSLCCIFFQDKFKEQKITNKPSGKDCS